MSLSSNLLGKAKRVKTKKAVVRAVADVAAEEAVVAAAKKGLLALLPQPLQTPMMKTMTKSNRSSTSPWTISNPS